MVATRFPRRKKWPIWKQIAAQLSNPIVLTLLAAAAIKPGDLLSIATERELPRLDEKLYLEVCPAGAAESRRLQTTTNPHTSN